MFTPPDPDAFNPLVWQIVRLIPYGRVSSYGQIASMIPAPPGYDPLRYNHVRARWVGTAMRLSVGSGIPWHRVINSQGTISNLPFPGAREEQRRRLEAEGVQFDLEGRVDFKRFGWEGPPETWLQERGLLPPTRLR
ncbi:MAG: methyltransferase [Anaerolineae bacterium]|nr:methyltransferase [Anaerolineae bacterium]